MSKEKLTDEIIIHNLKYFWEEKEHRLEALNLINRLKEENAELKAENERLRLERDVLIGKKIVEKQKSDKALIMKIDIQEQLKDRIAELEKENESLYDSYHKGYKVGYEYGKQDAVSSDRAESDSQTSETTQTDYKLKQFAKRLEEKAEDCYRQFGVFDKVDFTSILDETLKELLDE